MARTPLMNHWWNVPLYVTARGLTTSLIPAGARGVPDRLRLRRPPPRHHRHRRHDRDRCDLGAEDRSPTFYAELMDALDDLGLATPIWTMPVEIPDAIPFDTTTRTRVVRRASRSQRFWRALVQMDRVFEVFRSRFVGKVSPVHLFWGALDLAVTRFSGPPRAAAPRRRAELRAARHARGVLARGQQRRLLAGPRRRGRLLLLRLSRARRLRATPTSACPARPLRRRSSASSCSPTRRCARPPTPTGAAGVPAGHLRGRGDPGRVGPRRARRPADAQPLAGVVAAVTTVTGSLNLRSTRCGQVLAQPARQARRQRRDDDLVDRAASRGRPSRPARRRSRRRRRSR